MQIIETYSRAQQLQTRFIKIRPLDIEILKRIKILHFMTLIVNKQCFEYILYYEMKLIKKQNRNLIPRMEHFKIMICFHFGEPWFEIIMLVIILLLLFVQIWS